MFGSLSGSCLQRGLDLSAGSDVQFPPQGVGSPLHVMTTEPDHPLFFSASVIFPHFVCVDTMFGILPARSTDIRIQAKLEPRSIDPSNTESSRGYCSALPMSPVLKTGLRVAPVEPMRHSVAALIRQWQEWF